VGNNKSPIQCVLRGITGLGMTVCCCNVTVTADGLKLKHHGMTLCGRGRKLIALKVCVTGVHILGWQKSSNSCVNADRSVYRSLPQWGKHYLTTHHTQKMGNSGSTHTHHLMHTNKIVPNDSCSVEVGDMWHESTQQKYQFDEVH
jgi:hypothetical protein